MSYKIKNRDKLLVDIARELNKLTNNKSTAVDVNCVEVSFVCKASHDQYDFDLITALDCLSNDLFWDERGNWEDASEVIVRTI